MGGLLSSLEREFGEKNYDFLTKNIFSKTAKFCLPHHAYIASEHIELTTKLYALSKICRKIFFVSYNVNRFAVQGGRGNDAVGGEVKICGNYAEEAEIVRSFSTAKILSMTRRKIFEPKKAE